MARCTAQPKSDTNVDKVVQYMELCGAQDHTSIHTYMHMVYGLGSYRVDQRHTDYGVDLHERQTIPVEPHWVEEAISRAATRP